MFGTGYGGAIHISDSKANLLGNTFMNNTDCRNGGAICCLQCTLELIDDNVFHTNSVLYDSNSCIVLFDQNGGGAVYVEMGTVFINGSAQFSSNTANIGGAIALQHSALVIDVKENDKIEFDMNLADCDGGAIWSRASAVLTLESHNVHYLHNKASHGLGGAIYMYGPVTQNYLYGNDDEAPALSTVLSGLFYVNRALGGGAVYAQGEQITLVRTNFTGNSFQAISLFVSSATFINMTHFVGNNGAIVAKHSRIDFSGKTLFVRNKRSIDGGALDLFRGNVSFRGYTLFLENVSGRNGGAMYCSRATKMYMHNIVNFTRNKAMGSGGAMYLDSNCFIYFNVTQLAAASDATVLYTSGNYAKQAGGAVLYVDSPTIDQCESTYFYAHDELTPYCFLQLVGPIDHRQPLPVQIVSMSDKAETGMGNFLFGGLLDRCRLNNDVELFGKQFLENILIGGMENVTSRAYALCFSDDEHDYLLGYGCGRYRRFTVSRGQRVNVSLVAFAQHGLASTSVTAILGPTARLETTQVTQLLRGGRNTLQYTMYSMNSFESILLFPDSSCRHSDKVGVALYVTFLPCPDGFVQEREFCTCENRLKQFEVDCPSPYIVKRSGSNFWMGAVYTNESYQGLILASPCPLEYCKSQSVQLTLNDHDHQCDLNRAGLLCGGCAANHSLMLGGSDCQICSNSYLALIIPFALMGIALVVFLTFLRLTIATGVMNSLILYCNILQTIRTSLLPPNTRNVLTVFIAWMNLDFGILTCFYNGLDTYALTWLQFVFPVYVWLLIGSIILISRYSITMSKLIGHNPVAVLATLVLMSYMKVLKIIVEVFSSTELEYPDNITVTVWLKDANVPYLQSSHLVLTIATSVVLVLFFLPYTLLILFGHKLYRFTGRRYFKWFNRIKPL